MESHDDAGVETSPDAFALAAESLAARWPTYDLAFSPASLARLDDLVADAWAGGDATDVTGADDTDPVVAFGAYLGETLVRSTDAAWVETEPDHWAVVVYGDGEVTVNVFQVASECLHDDLSFAHAYETTVAETDPGA
jgi:hypothetical protein